MGVGEDGVVEICRRHFSWTKGKWGRAAECKKSETGVVGGETLVTAPWGLQQVGRVHGGRMCPYKSRAGVYPPVVARFPKRGNNNRRVSRCAAPSCCHVRRARPATDG